MCSSVCSVCVYCVCEQTNVICLVFVDAFRSIVRDEGGLLSLYRGIIPALFLTSHGAIQFMAYEKLKQHMGDLQSAAEGSPSNGLVRVLCFCGSACVMHVLMVMYYIYIV